MVEWLRLLNHEMRMLTSIWTDTPSVSWYDAGDGKGKRFHGAERSRDDIALSEYPENRADEWLRTAVRLRHAADALNRMAEYADAQANEAEIEPRLAPCGCPNSLIADEGHQSGCSERD
jgi:hypothetical protein